MISYKSNDEGITIPFIVMSYWTNQLENSFIKEFIDLNKLLNTTVFEQFVPRFYAFKQAVYTISNSDVLILAS